MAKLLGLPDELLTEIYVFAGHQIHTLVRLSAVNRRLRTIWVGDADSIITQAVLVFTPNHQEAIPLTRLEARCPLPTTGFHTLNDSDQGPPLRLCLPQLMRNIALVSDVCCRVQVSRNIEILLNPGCGLPKCKLEPLYYLTRTFLVAYHWPSLRPPLYAALQALTDESLYRFTEMCLRILAIEPDGFWPQKHLLHKPVEQYTEDDFLVIGPPGGRAYHVADMWAFVHDLGRRVRWNRTEGRTEEPGAGYHTFGGKIMHDDYLDPVRIEMG
jgi:hypothetical protein